MKRIILLMMLLTAVITACESAPDPDQDVYGYSFDLTCKDTGLNKANPYQPGDGINQIIVMSDSTIGDQYDEYTQQFTGDMPEEWFPQINEASCPNMFSLFTEGEKNPDQFPVVEEAQIQTFIEKYVTQ